MNLVKLSNKSAIMYYPLFEKKKYMNWYRFEKCLLAWTLLVQYVEYISSDIRLWWLNIVTKHGSSPSLPLSLSCISFFSLDEEASFNKKSVTDVNGGFVYCVKFHSFKRVRNVKSKCRVFAHDTRSIDMAFICFDMYHYLNHNAHDIVWCHFVGKCDCMRDWKTEDGRSERDKKQWNRLLRMWYVSQNACDHNFEMVQPFFLCTKSHFHFGIFDVHVWAVPRYTSTDARAHIVHPLIARRHGPFEMLYLSFDSWISQVKCAVLSENWMLKFIFRSFDCIHVTIRNRSAAFLYSLNNYERILISTIHWRWSWPTHSYMHQM